MVTTKHWRVGLISAVLLAGGAQAASAQSPRVIRGDVAATIGWLAADTHSAGPYDRNNWVNSFLTAASTGWHWTDNLKTEVDFGAGTDSRLFHTEAVSIAGRSTFQTIESRFARRTIGFSQQYQFFHNAWFHPHLAVGVNVNWQRRRDNPHGIYFYDPATGTSHFQPPNAATERTSWTANPFIAIGYKAYVSDRAFFRNDFRMSFHGGPDDTVFRLGIGVDF
jgi:hypothetical protein